jgi:hypothetical protein
MTTCEICEGTFIALDKHHIQSRSRGGDNNTFNIAKICPNCHRLVHKGEIIIEGKFNSTAGPTLVWRDKKEGKIIELFKDPEVYLM